MVGFTERKIMKEGDQAKFSVEFLSVFDDAG
jgi:hypothetical protein